MDEITAAEVLRMSVIVAPAFLLGRRRHDDLARQQRFDSLVDGRLVACGLLEQPDGERPLTKQLARSGELRGRVRLGRDLDAVDRDAHERTGSSARVRGVRTI